LKSGIFYVGDRDYKLKSIQSIQSKLNSIESKLKSIQSNFKSIQNKLKSIESKLKSVESNFKSIQNKLKSIESKLKSLKIYHFLFHTILYPVPCFFHTILYPKFVRGGGHTNLYPTLIIFQYISACYLASRLRTLCSYLNPHGPAH